MVDPQWKTTFSWLAPLHQGLPDWFPKVINHVLRFLQGRDRFNLYNTCRALATKSDSRLNTHQLRDTLQRFVGQGLRFTGVHSQKVILDRRLILFWSRFLIPACETSLHDLSVFHAALQAWRFEDLTANPVIKQLMLPSYRSFTKEHVTRHCLQSLFSNPEKYRQFVDWQVSQLSQDSIELYTALRKGPQLALDIICNDNGWLAICELWNALLVHPSYETREEKIFLQLDTFKGFERPFHISPTAARPITTPESGLEPIRVITRQLLKGHTVPLSACNCGRTFFDRQLDLFRESAGNLIDETRRFLGWWYDTIGQGCISREELPASGCVLTLSSSGRYVPFIIEWRNLEHILETSLKFGLLTKDSENRLCLSRLGCMFISGAKPDLEVKTIWARNVNRLSLRLGECWSDGFHRFLNLLATSSGHGEYVVTPASLAKSGLKTDLALVIIGGFTWLDARRIERLSRWVTDTEEKGIPHKTFLNREIRSDEVDQSCGPSRQTGSS